MVLPFADVSFGEDAGREVESSCIDLEASLEGISRPFEGCGNGVVVSYLKYQEPVS